MKKKRLNDSNSFPSEEELRKRAIKLYEQNWKVSDICQALHCSKSWFYKWLNRYKTTDNLWFKSESRKPKTVPQKID